MSKMKSLKYSWSSPSLKFVCLHFKLIVSQTFILLKNLSQVRMFSGKLPTICIYSRAVNCPENFKMILPVGRFLVFAETKIKYFLAFVHLIDVKTELL